ncbi:hypothetical protein FOZ62_031020 [Perkinsus olseni]|uniref:Uncharacterized protein n=1 Tax=Perkinsus olseni TaxID=32597 RepID=A0A7J6RX36_PEROL|nr:hypothetical protein FOZ62_031020 [Perkinsus olseni]
MLSRGGGHLFSRPLLSSVALHWSRGIALPAAAAASQGGLVDQWAVEGDVPQQTFKDFVFSGLAKRQVESLCPKEFSPQKQYFDQYLPEGSRLALKALASEVTSERMSDPRYVETIEESLVEAINEGKKIRKESGYELEVEILDIPKVSIQRVNLVVGGSRRLNKDFFKGKMLVNPVLMPQLYVVLSEDQLERSGGQFSPFMDIFNTTIGCGAAVLVDVRMECQQRYCVRGLPEAADTAPAEETAVHEIRMEMTLNPIPGSGSYPVDGRFTGGHWQVTDFNRVLNGNFPIPLPLLNRESFDTGTYKSSGAGGEGRAGREKITDWPDTDESSSSSSKQR